MDKRAYWVQISSFKALCLAFLFSSDLAFAEMKGAPFQADHVTAINVNEITEEQERRVGYAMDALVQENFLVLERENRWTITVDQIGQRLAKVSDRPDLKYTFKVISNDGWANAISAPGGFVYVTTGLIKILEAKDELAAVLAHEIGHITARHGIKQAQTEQRWKKIEWLAVNILAAAGAAAAGQAVQSATGSSQTAEFAARAGASTAGGLAESLSEVFTTMMLSAHSREDEREADELGLRYLQRAGYKEAAALSVFSKLETLAAREQSVEGGIFATHPPATERREAILHHLTSRNGR